MSAEIKKEIRVEIAHVLFIDIVGYSKLSINEQNAAVDELTQIVRATEQFQKAEASERLVKISTGDGMALVFYTNPEAPVSQILEALAVVWQRKGQWQRSLEYFQQAKALDPRDVQLLCSQATLYQSLRQYPAALNLCDQVLEISPGNSVASAIKARVYQAEGNLPAAATLLSSLHLEPDHEDFPLQIDQWIYERRYAEALAVLKNAIDRRDRPLRSWQKEYYNRAFGLLQRFSGDADGARSTWQRIENESEELSRSTKEDFFWTYLLAFAYAALGDETKALTTLDRAEAVERRKDDSVRLALFVEMRAEIAVIAGDNNLALGQLAISAQQPNGTTYGDLKFNPLWDPLRGDPRFEKIIISLTPK
jgi:tetratricopeptide (TPR) repeat protein